MLDGSGYNSDKKVECFLCGENELTVPMYTPTQDHQGGELKAPACIRIDPREKGLVSKYDNWKSAKLFTIRPFSPKQEDQCECDPNHCNENQLCFEPYQLSLSHELYHRTGFCLPDFGDGINQVIYVCGTCFKEKQAEQAVCAKIFDSYSCKKGSALREALVNKFCRNAERHIGEALTALLQEGMLKLSSKGARRKVRKLPPGTRDYLEKHLSWSHRNIRHVGENQGAAKIAKRVRPFAQAILPPK